ncbi:MAG: hypothetical protein FWD74_12535, partial [Actinomycetia bacterium]|nr:hypothetical protein [Actinomycetes bacterium]
AQYPGQGYPQSPSQPPYGGQGYPQQPPTAPSYPTSSPSYPQAEPSYQPTAPSYPPTGQQPYGSSYPTQTLPPSGYGYAQNPPPPTGPTAPSKPSHGGRNALIAAAVVIVLVAAGLVIWKVTGKSSNKNNASTTTSAPATSPSTPDFTSQPTAPVTQSVPTTPAAPPTEQTAVTTPPIPTATGNTAATGTLSVPNTIGSFHKATGATADQMRSAMQQSLQGAGGDMFANPTVEVYSDSTGGADGIPTLILFVVPRGNAQTQGMNDDQLTTAMLSAVTQDAKSFDAGSHGGSLRCGTGSGIGSVCAWSDSQTIGYLMNVGGGNAQQMATMTNQARDGIH